MTAPPKKPPSKGLMMIAAYRAERLARRSSVLEAGGDDSRFAHRASGDAESVSDGAPPGIAPTLVAGGEPTTVEPAPVDPASPAAGEQRDNLAASLPRPLSAASALRVPRADDDHAAGGYVEIQTVRARSEGGRADITEPTGTVATPLPQDSQPDHASTAIEARRLVADAPAASEYDPPLAEIGFGPGMVIRLGQIGLHTASDLAQADADRIRSDLGEISRLFDVDGWIRSARQIKSSQSAFPDIPGDPGDGQAR